MKSPNWFEHIQFEYALEIGIEKIASFGPYIQLSSKLGQSFEFEYLTLVTITDLKSLSALKHFRKFVLVSVILCFIVIICFYSSSSKITFFPLAIKSV